MIDDEVERGDLVIIDDTEFQTPLYYGEVEVEDADDDDNEDEEDDDSE